ncbi:MAG: MFS transporter [Clostridia bacterium]|nr:MFS transporter [Clostridia bacterium]
MSNESGAGQAKKFVEGIFAAEENSAENLDQSKLNKYSNIAVRMFHTPVLTVKEMLFPGIAEFATCMLSALEQYRTLYFVNVLKIDMTYVTWILTLIGIYDVLNNPLMGIIYDKTRTRWGKARPYVVATALPYYISSFVMYSGAIFLSNASANDPKKIVFVFVMLFIQETFSTIYGIPRGNLLSLQTANPNDRIKVGLIQQYTGYVGSQLVFLLFIPFMELTNKQVINVPMPLLFSIFSIVSCAAGVFGNMAMGLRCKERILLQPKPAPVTKTMFYILKNKYALRNFIASFSVSWWSSGGYKWDVVTQQEIFGGMIPSFVAYVPYNVLTYLSVGLIPKFRKLFKNNNRNGVVFLRLWDLITCVIMCAIGIPFVDKRWYLVGLYAVCYGLNGLNDGPARVFEAELGREINDYTEYVTGERPDGTIGILTGLITKITAPINALLTVKLFKWSGYDTTITMLPWSQGSKVIYQKVFFLFIGISILPDVIRMIPYLFYDLVGEKREKMYIALNERRALMANEDEGNAELEEMVQTLAHESE